jgi:transposase
MKKRILVGCDLHDRNMLLLVSCEREAPVKRSFRNNAEGRRAMLHFLGERARLAGGAEIVFGYEASSLGFGLHDELSAAGVRCHVLAPSKLQRSPQERCLKTDEKDALRLLEVLRGHVLAGNALPAVWIPDLATRDDRELVRARLDTQAKSAKVKTQLVTLLKRNGLARPPETGKSWTRAFRGWLATLGQDSAPLKPGARSHVNALLRQMEFLEAEVARLDEDVAALARTPRYAGMVRALRELKGVGVLTAMVFLTEMGDVRRFKNRRQVAAYLGVVPVAHESGERADRKGRITRQGSPRLRNSLCQAAWNRVRAVPREREVYERIKAKNPQAKKKAVVAEIRRLGIRMWHTAVNALNEAELQEQHGTTRLAG